MSYKEPMRPESEMKYDRADLNKEQEAHAKKCRGRAMTKSEQMDWDKRQDQIDDLTDQIERSKRIKQRKGREADEARGHHVTDDETHPLPVAFSALSNGEARSITDATMPHFHQRALTSVGAEDTIKSPDKTGEYFFTDLQSGTMASLKMDIKNGVKQNEAIVNFTDLPATTIHAEGDEMPEGGMLSVLLAYILKNFVIRVDIVNNVTRDAVTDWAKILREAFARSLDAKLTQQFLSGPGTTEILGIDNVVGVQTVDAGSVTLTWDMILQSVQKIIAANGSLDMISVIMHPAAWLQLQSLKDTTGQQITKPSGLDGVPMIVHTAVATDYGAGSDETRVYVGDFSTCKLGIGGKYEITSEKSKADHDVTQFIMVYRADLQVFHPDRIVRIENVAIA
jgi:HK97 family phage major capsid protein